MNKVILEGEVKKVVERDNGIYITLETAETKMREQHSVVFFFDIFEDKALEIEEGDMISVEGMILYPKSKKDGVAKPKIRAKKYSIIA